MLANNENLMRTHKSADLHFDSSVSSQQKVAYIPPSVTTLSTSSVTAGFARLETDGLQTGS